MSRLLAQILVPPFTPELLIDLPLLLLLLALRFPLINSCKPLFPRGVMLGLVGVLHHAGVHRLLLLAAEDGGGEGVVHGTGGEIYISLAKSRNEKGSACIPLTSSAHLLRTRL